MGNLKAKAKQGEDRELAPAGKYFGVIVSVIDIGTQAFKHKADRQVVVTWELHKRKGPALDSKGRNLTVSDFYTLKFGEYQGKKAKLRQLVESMFNRTFTPEEVEDGYDVEDLVGEACGLQIVHEAKAGDANKKYAKIASVFSLDEDDEKPTSELDEVYYEVDPSRNIPDEVLKWLHPMIERSKEWVAAHGQPKGKDGQPKAAASTGGSPARPAASSDDEDDDDIPF
jgi:hypothetical protein